MAMDPPSKNGDGISCHGQGLKLNAYGGMDLTWMDLDDTGLGTRDLYPEYKVFYVQRDVDSTGMVHYKKSARFPNTENGDVKEGTDKTMTQQHTSTFNMFRLR